MFLLNSCLSLFSAASSLRHPFSRSYGVILPNSLTMLLPSALGFSPHLPVSVCGTGLYKTIAAFLGSWLTRFTTLVRSTSQLCLDGRICQSIGSSACTGITIPGSCFPSASPQFCLYKVQESQPVVHRLRLSTSPLAPTYPEQISFTLETLDIRPRGFSPLSRYSFRHSLFLYLHCSLSVQLRQRKECSSTNDKCHSTASVLCFSPGHFRRRTSRLVSCYALFECVAASEPTS